MVEAFETAVMYSLDTTLLLNKTTLQRIQKAGFPASFANINNIQQARRFGLWSQRSGSEIYLLALISSAVRWTALRSFSSNSLTADRNRLFRLGQSLHVPDIELFYTLFVHHYPSARPVSVHPAQSGLPDQDGRLSLLAEGCLLYYMTDNPALEHLDFLFDDSELRRQVDYPSVIAHVDRFIYQDGKTTHSHRTLLDLLLAPKREYPHSLLAQGQFICTHWAPWLPEPFIQDIRRAMASHQEEFRPRPGGPGPVQVPRFGQGEESDAPAAFSTDEDWMSSAVLLAKSVYVWLDQLSKKYQQPINTLADIPEQELAGLSRWGFNTIWLIGIWERSSASKKIKQLSGNPEAAASAYALNAYRVAEELGGEAGLKRLEQKCQEFGLRLACDIVPNHTGIDSEWVKEHPEWFIHSESPPFPGYRYTGPDLSESQEISLRIEDGYWDHSDAAVAFEYFDHRRGKPLYLYHGNDGTHMPWNDTAQLNFLLAEVRAAMVELIVKVAQRFSMIRFDAAMTLARKHFRRLWFPPPGGSAGVPSRSEFCLPDETFNAAFPDEFWREVVKRIQREAPGTLLIAEAFWLMESYFVRNLGMHRVYNSAFMNLLKREENAKYRKILKETLAYNPEVLKRYVNFMNNPDEATAVEQFGTGDKYFGVATLLVTLPGLPMFGHGQIEGYREKYGMEYRRAYWQETPDEGFIAHHEKVIFPLLQQRHVYGGVEHFSLFDFSTENGTNDHVYVFSNGPPGQKSLVVYNNSSQPTQGLVRDAVPQAKADREGTPVQMPDFFDTFALRESSGDLLRFRTLAGMDYLLHIRQIKDGLPMSLDSYEYRVCMDFQLFHDPEGSWYSLNEKLQGRAVPALDHEYQRLRYHALWTAFLQVVNLERLNVLKGLLSAKPVSRITQDIIIDLSNDVRTLAKEIAALKNVDFETGGSTTLKASFLACPAWLGRWEQADYPESLLKSLWDGDECAPLGAIALAWLAIHGAFQLLPKGLAEDFGELSDLYGLGMAWHEQILTPSDRQAMFLINQLCRIQEQEPDPATDHEAFLRMVTQPNVPEILGMHEFADKTWITREGITAFAGGLALRSVIKEEIRSSTTSETKKNLSHAVSLSLRERLAHAAAVGYRLDKFLQFV